MNKFKEFFNITDTEGKIFKSAYWLTFVGVFIDFLPFSEAMGTLASVIIGVSISVAVWRDNSFLVKEKGLSAPSKWWLFLPVVYFFKRPVKINKPNRRQGWLYLALTILSIGSALVSLNIDNQNELDTFACSLASDTNLLKENDVQCVKVTESQKVAEKWWKGKILLSSGKEVNYTLHNTEGDYYQIQLNYF